MNFDIYSYFAGLLTAIIIALIKHFLSKSHTAETIEQNRTQVACDKFRAAIAQEIALWHSRINNPSDFDLILALEKSSITAAIVEFRPFVKKQIKDYNRTHNTYNIYKKDIYSIDSKHCIKLLENLLQFTEK